MNVKFNAKNNNKSLIITNIYITTLLNSLIRRRIKPQMKTSTKSFFAFQGKLPNISISKNRIKICAITLSDLLYQKNYQIIYKTRKIKQPLRICLPIAVRAPSSQKVICSANIHRHCCNYQLDILILNFPQESYISCRSLNMNFPLDTLYLKPPPIGNRVIDTQQNWTNA